MTVTLSAASTLSLFQREAASARPVDRPTVPTPTPAPAAKPQGPLGADRLETSSLTDGNLKARLEPVLQLMTAAGFAKEAARVRRAHIKLTEGKAFGVEYYAAAYPFNVICLNRHTFQNLSPKELASVLIHEGTHLDQSLVVKGYSNIRSLGGRQLAHDVAEKEAYLKQQRANERLGLTSGEIYWTTNEALKEMGVAVKGDL
jgi:Zn-dependent protease with chaperone function